MSSRSMKFEFEADGTVLVSCTALVQRLNRHLIDLIPKRMLVFNYKEKNYMLKVVDVGPEHGETRGPVFYKYLVALGDYINMWTLQERHYTNKVVVERDKRFAQVPLPSSLRFSFMTPALARTKELLYNQAVSVEENIARLQAAGAIPANWTVGHDAQGRNVIVTAPVSAPMQTDTPSQQELTDEEIVNRAFDDKEQPPEQGDELTPEQEEALMGAPEPIMQDPLGLRATPEN